MVSAPKNTIVVGCHQVYTLKYRPNGSVNRYKAILVVRGYTHNYGMDYFETFTPVARLNSIRIMFFIVVNLSWPLFQLNVKNTFLYGDLKEEIYMEQPPGYVAHGKNKIYRLRKAIYKLKQSSKALFEKISITISGISFHRCHSNHSIFVRHTKSSLVILAVYVNDILLIGSDSAGLVETKKYLRRHFVSKDMSKPKYFLGIEVAHQKKCDTFLSKEVCSRSSEENMIFRVQPC